MLSNSSQAGKTHDVRNCVRPRSAAAVSMFLVDLCRSVQADTGWRETNIGGWRSPRSYPTSVPSAWYLVLRITWYSSVSDTIDGRTISLTGHDDVLCD